MTVKTLLLISGMLITIVVPAQPSSRSGEGNLAGSHQSARGTALMMSIEVNQVRGEGGQSMCGAER